jgi:hypothetical protein
MAKAKLEAMIRALGKAFGGVEVTYLRIPRFHQFSVKLPRVVHSICFSVSVVEADDPAALTSLCRLAASHLRKDPDGTSRTVHITRHGMEEQPRA